MVSYTFLSPHAFLVGPVQGVRGPDFTMSHSQFLSKIWSLGVECGFQEAGANGYDRRAERATSFHILSKPFYISDLSGCFSYGFPPLFLPPTAIDASNGSCLDDRDPCKRLPPFIN